MTSSASGKRRSQPRCRAPRLADVLHRPEPVEVRGERRVAEEEDPQGLGWRHDGDVVRPLARDREPPRGRDRERGQHEEDARRDRRGRASGGKEKSHPALAGWPSDSTTAPSVRARRCCRRGTAATLPHGARRAAGFVRARRRPGPRAVDRAVRVEERLEQQTQRLRRSGAVPASPSMSDSACERQRGAVLRATVGAAAGRRAGVAAVGVALDHPVDRAGGRDVDGGPDLLRRARAMQPAGRLRRRDEVLAGRRPGRRRRWRSGCCARPGGGTPRP